MSTAPTDTVSILVVEDDASVRQLVADMLAPTGHRVVSCRDAEEALAAVTTEGPFHLVVTDVSLPDLSGPELVERLRREAPELKALLISGGEDVGNDLPFLAKPFTVTELRSKVEGVLAAGEPSR